MKNDKIEYQFHEHPVLAGVDDGVREHLYNASRATRVEVGAHLMAEDQVADICWLLVRGSVRIFSASRDGLEVTHQVLRAPAVLGASECLLHTPYAHSALAIEPATLAAVPAAALWEAVVASPVLSRNLLRDVAGRLVAATHRQKTTALYGVAPQLAQALVSFADAFGCQVSDGIKIRIPLTHIDLANTLGTATRSVARAVTLWARQGLLVKRGRYLVIRDRARLARIAESQGLPMVYSSELPLSGKGPTQHNAVVVLGRRRELQLA